MLTRSGPNSTVTVRAAPKGAALNTTARDLADRYAALPESIRSRGITVTARIIALCNQKGGVGKSTTTFHLARAAVLRGQRVLVVDNNPHGNLTSVAAAEPVDDDQAGLADALSSRAPETIRDGIVAGGWAGPLGVAPPWGTPLGYVPQYYTPGLRVPPPPIPKRVVISDATE